jgi:hypothetical protein
MGEIYSVFGINGKCTDLKNDQGRNSIGYLDIDVKIVLKGIL